MCSSSTSLTTISLPWDMSWKRQSKFPLLNSTQRTPMCFVEDVLMDRLLFGISLHKITESTPGLRAKLEREKKRTSQQPMRAREKNPRILSRWSISANQVLLLLTKTLSVILLLFQVPLTSIRETLVEESIRISSLSLRTESWTFGIQDPSTKKP